MNETDAEHLRLLSIFHYVVAGLGGMFALFPVIHLVIGLFLLTFGGDREMGAPGARAVGAFFVAIASLWILVGLSYAVAMIVAGRHLARRKSHTFCLVMAGISCLFMPLGTVLGVFTIVVLMRDSVKAAFDGSPS